MENVNEVIDKMADNFQKFVRTNVKSAQLEVYERVTNVISSGISSTIIISLLMLTVFFVNFGLASWLGTYIDNKGLGYVIVGGFYFVALLLYLLLRNKVGKNTIKNAILKKVSKTHEDFDLLLEEQDEVHAQVDETMVAIRENIGELKTLIAGPKEQESEAPKGEIIPRPMVVSSVNFMFRSVLFKNGGFIKRDVIPMIVNTILTSKLYREGKLKSFIANIKQSMRNRSVRKSGN